MAKQYETSFAVRQLAITNSGFTDIQGAAVLPIDCNYIEILNDSGQDVILATDPNNVASQITIHDGQMFSIGAARGFDTKQCRFQAGDSNPIAAVKSASSSVNVIILSIR